MCKTGVNSRVWSISTVALTTGLFCFVCERLHKPDCRSPSVRPPPVSRDKICRRRRRLSPITQIHSASIDDDKSTFAAERTNERRNEGRNANAVSIGKEGKWAVRSLMPPWISHRAAAFLGASAGRVVSKEELCYT